MTTTYDGDAAAGPGSGAPGVVLRLVTRRQTPDGEVTRRIDVSVGAGESVAVEDGATTTFPTERLWPQVRDRLPDVGLLRADPRGRPTPERRAPTPDLAERATAYVVLAVALTGGGLDTELAVRTWFATDDELWQASPQPDGTTDVRPAAVGALADLLVWDVTGAFDLLVRSATP